MNILPQMYLWTNIQMIGDPEDPRIRTVFALAAVCTLNALAYHCLRLLDSCSRND